jgi:peroxiredoxin
MKQLAVIILSLVLTAVAVAQEPGDPSGRRRGGPRAGARRGGGIIKDRSVYKPLEVGQSIPEAVLLDGKGKKVNLNKLVSEQPCVLIFFRGGWCPFCNIHMAELVKIQPDLGELGFRTVAITTDKPELLKQSIEKHKMDYLLLSDPDLKVASGFGIRIEISDFYKQHLLRDKGMTLSQTTGVSDDYLPVPSVFIVDKKGRVRFVHSDEKHRVRISNKALLAAAKEAR